MVIMAITVKDLFQYDANFDPVKIRRLTGKSNFSKNDIVDLSRLAALNDKNLSVFVAKKEGKSFINHIQDDNMKTAVADISLNQKKNSKVLSSNTPIDKSIFDYQ